MDTQEYEQRQTTLQKATRDWLLRGQANAFITLTFRSEAGVSFSFGEKAFGAFIHDLKCNLFGEKSKKRLFVVPVIEGYVLAKHEPNRTHIHILVKFPGDPLNYKEVVRRSWMASSRLSGDPLVYDPSNEQWFKDISDQELCRIETNYVLKTCAMDTEAILWKYVPKLDA